jgi:hypothetical protein
LTYYNKEATRLFDQSSPSTKQQVLTYIDRRQDERKGIFDPMILNTDGPDEVSRKLQDVQVKEWQYLTS